MINEESTDIIPLKIRRWRKITIPRKYCDKYNLKEGDTVLLMDKDKELRIVTMEKVFPNTVQ